MLPTRNTVRYCISKPKNYVIGFIILSCMDFLVINGAGCNAVFHANKTKITEPLIPPFIRNPQVSPSAIYIDIYIDAHTCARRVLLCSWHSGTACTHREFFLCAKLKFPQSVVVPRARAISPRNFQDGHHVVANDFLGGEHFPLQRVQGTLPPPPPHPPHFPALAHFSAQSGARQKTPPAPP